MSEEGSQEGPLRLRLHANPRAAQLTVAASLVRGVCVCVCEEKHVKMVLIRFFVSLLTLFLTLQSQACGDHFGDRTCYLYVGIWMLGRVLLVYYRALALSVKPRASAITQRGRYNSVSRPEAHWYILNVMLRGSFIVWSEAAYLGVRVCRRLCRVVRPNRSTFRVCVCGGCYVYSPLLALRGEPRTRSAGCVQKALSLTLQPFVGALIGGEHSDARL